MAGRTYNKDLSKERLNEIFGNESQIVTANRLHTSQGNVSKWKKGEAKPTTEFLLDISAVYDVSIDWILGLSNNKRTTDIDIESLTYEQVIKVLDRLLEYESFILPNLNKVGTNQQYEASTEDDSDDEDTFEPELYDSDFLKCNDRLLSFLLRKRIKCLGVDDDTYVMWSEKNHHIFNETGIVDCRGNFNDALDLSPQPPPDSSGWRDRMKELSELTEEERQEIINDYKEGKLNG